MPRVLFFVFRALLGVMLRSERPFGDRRDSSLTSSENLSAPDANEANARLAVLAATVPKAAANFRPDPNAASAIRSPARIVSSELFVLSLLGWLALPSFLLGFFAFFERDALAKSVTMDGHVVDI